MHAWNCTRINANLLDPLQVSLLWSFPQLSFALETSQQVQLQPLSWSHHRKLLHEEENHAGREPACYRKPRISNRDRPHLSPGLASLLQDTPGWLAKRLRRASPGKRHVETPPPKMGCPSQVSLLWAFPLLSLALEAPKQV